jgi:heavy metal translocating P-type ATPase
VATAAESTYAGIVRLVEEAEKQKAPSVRVADRYAVIFIPVTLVIAGAAWLFSGDPVRALSVLVVATPCPLILAVPIAVVAGISRAARRGIIVKGGGALETLARGKVLLFDKTGTLTAGIPQVADVEVFEDISAEALLRLAASLDVVSPHVLATSIVRAARDHGLALVFPTDVVERYGAGIEGKVDGSRVALGKASFVAAGVPMPRRAREVRRRTSLDGSSCVFIAVDGTVAGALVIDDPIRPDSPRVIRTLRRAGIDRVVMVTGDHPDVAESVGAALGVDRVLSERDPSEKVHAVEAEREEGVTIFVGDGLNDAPALAAADVGVAMGARGATASSEAADIVLIVDRLDRDRSPIEADRGTERGGRHGARVGWDAPRSVRTVAPRRRRHPAGVHRRLRDPQLAQGAPWRQAAAARLTVDRRGGSVPHRASGVRSGGPADPDHRRPFGPDDARGNPAGVGRGPRVPVGAVAGT